MNNLNTKCDDLLREFYYEKNSKNEFAISRFVVENNESNFEKEIVFNAVHNSMADISVTILSNVSGKISINLNDVDIFDIDNSSTFTCCKKVYVKDVNSLCVDVKLSQVGNVKIFIEISGEIFFIKEKLINAKYIGDILNIVKDDLLSQNKDILSITNNIFNKNHYNKNNIEDHNVSKINTQNNTYLYSYIYLENNVLKISDDKTIMELGDNVDGVCMLSSDDVDYFYRLVFVNNGQVKFKIFNIDFDLVSEYSIDSLRYLNIKEVKSISSNVACNYFWAKSQDGFWYLIGINNLGEIFHVRQYVKCDDISSYFYNGLHYVLELDKYGITVSLFRDIALSENEKNIKFYNANNAFIFKNILYLLVGDIVQEIEL